MTELVVAVVATEEVEVENEAEVVEEAEDAKEEEDIEERAECRCNIVRKGSCCNNSMTSLLLPIERVRNRFNKVI